MDLDKFKCVNDKYGHQMGDDILREFVMVIASSILPEDRLVRWGGEEFVVFCPNTNIEQAVKKQSWYDEMLRRTSGFMVNR